MILSILVEFCYAEIHKLPIYADCECYYAECHYAECHYAECRYVECCGTLESLMISIPFFTILVLT